MKIPIICFIGVTDVIIIGIIALLLFGGKELPKFINKILDNIKESKKHVKENHDIDDTTKSKE